MATKPKMALDTSWQICPGSTGHHGAVQNQSESGVMIYLYVTEVGNTPPEQDGILLDAMVRTLPIRVGANEVMHARTAVGVGYVRLI
ncbi:hypothetical protein HWQ46_25295 [Shewanella sp. D64]|uniref:hypothetical protein n=1 Tax=unclassified Shewanella TaxID=196818 RepID=UPI0022BA6954|nr:MULTISPECIES: hypothetical protein [unclassified Shewanella]MEC4728834.1 hypothetical protein [Shewanella sp. D64]MEC4740708.1 hypothetical protein [Shewanella sp. E94]WBJ95333.1 hypothetical protein HWQ47_26690 [Shewanella sp. MTB7]